MYKIIVVEDDSKIAEILCDYLHKYGYETIHSSKFEDVKSEFLNISPDLVLLDINLPYMDGFFWCRQIRTVSKVPVIFISARSAYSHHTSELLTRDERSQFHIDFTNRWAHAMKTPVSVIDLLVQQSRETISLEEARTFFESIQEENERIAHGLDMMLGVARQERFSVDLFPEQVNLAELTREVINKHKKEFIRYAVYPRIEVSAKSACVETDRKWTAFVIEQLLSNAIKYTRVASQDTDKKLLIRIEDKRRAEADTDVHVDANAVMLTVEDYGVGIPEHDLPRIFDPFFTGENGRLAPEATGMGLFLANRICRELGHALTVRSKQGQGTAMTIAFSTKAITSGVTVNPSFQ